MNVLILDPAQSTGYCVIEVNNKQANIVVASYIDVEPNDHLGHQYLQFLDNIERIVDFYKIEVIAHEDFFFSRLTSTGANLNCSYRAMIQLLAAKKKIPYHIINITLWKKFINGSSRPTKEQVKKWGKEPSKKLMTQESLWNNWQIRFPNHSISEKTGKPIKFRYDIVDAVGMAVFFSLIHLRVQTISYTVKQIPDVEWKKIPAGTFLY